MEWSCVDCATYEQKGDSIVRTPNQDWRDASHGGAVGDPEGRVGVPNYRDGGELHGVRRPGVRIFRMDVEPPLLPSAP